MKQYIILSLLMAGSFLQGSEKHIRQKFSEQYPQRWYSKYNDCHTRLAVKHFIWTIDKTIGKFENYKNELLLFPYLYDEPSDDKSLNIVEKDFSLLDIYNYFIKKESCDHNAIKCNYKELLNQIRPDNHELLYDTHELLHLIHISWIEYQKYCDIKKRALVLYGQYLCRLNSKSKDN